MQTPVARLQVPAFEHSTSTSRASSVEVATATHGAPVAQDRCEQSYPVKSVKHEHVPTLVSQAPCPEHALGQSSEASVGLVCNVNTATVTAFTTAARKQAPRRCELVSIAPQPAVKPTLRGRLEWWVNYCHACRRDKGGGATTQKSCGVEILSRSLDDCVWIARYWWKWNRPSKFRGQ